MTRLAILGGGGLARELRGLLRAINNARPTYSFAGFVVRDANTEQGDGIVGGWEWLVRNASEIDGLVIGVGTPAIRRRLVEQCRRELPAVNWPVLIHPTVCFDPESCQIGQGVVICAGTQLTVNVRMNNFAFCNLNCTVGHEAVVGSFTVVNPGVNISGGVRVGSDVLLGTGAQVLENLEIGDGATVGAGAVVTKSVEPGVTVVGVPARPR